MNAEPIVHIVDDEAPLRGALALLARSVQLKAQTYASAAEFLDAWRPGAPGCLVLDVRMPGMSGIDLLERLRDVAGALPAIVMTGHGDVSTAVRAMRAGAIDFIEKPFQDQALLDLIHEGIRRSIDASAQAAARATARARIGSLTPHGRTAPLPHHGEDRRPLAVRAGAHGAQGRGSQRGVLKWPRRVRNLQVSRPNAARVMSSVLAITPRTSTSRRLASGRAGTPGMPTPAAALQRRRGAMSLMPCTAWWCTRSTDGRCALTSPLLFVTWRPLSDDPERPEPGDFRGGVTMGGQHGFGMLAQGRRGAGA